MQENKRFSFRVDQDHDVRFNRLIFCGLPDGNTNRALAREWNQLVMSTLIEERQAKANAESLISE